MSLLEKMGSSQPSNNQNPLLVMQDILATNQQINAAFNIMKQMTGGNPQKAREENRRE